MTEPHSPFIQFLYRCHDDNNRAVMAELRRGLGRGNLPMASYKHVARFVPKDAPWRETAMMIVAPLFAMHNDKGDVTLPEALRRRANEKGSGSIESRFAALLDSDVEDLPIQLRHAIGLVRGAALDWDDILKALEQWSHPDRYIQRKWARQFWAPQKSADADNSKAKVEK